MKHSVLTDRLSEKGPNDEAVTSAKATKWEAT